MRTSKKRYDAEFNREAVSLTDTSENGSWAFICERSGRHKALRMGSMEAFSGAGQMEIRCLRLVLKEVR